MSITTSSAVTGTNHKPATPAASAALPPPSALPPASATKGGTKVVGLKFTPDLRAAAESVLALPPGSGTDVPDDDDADADADEQQRVPVNKHGDEEGDPRDVLKTAMDEAARTSALPLTAVPAMRDILSAAASAANDTSTDSSSALREKLEAALSTSGLVFTVKVPEDNRTSEEIKEAEKFQRRMDKLRMKAEENRYHRLTQNLDKVVDDDVTVKSMSYAASVGLNMIVAPLSFGAFVYFFVGQLWYKDDDEDDPPVPGRTNNNQIKRVMLGVLAGVGMMFVEMILFVIRTHEFDASMTKKKRRDDRGPFGRKVKSK